MTLDNCRKHGEAQAQKDQCRITATNISFGPRSDILECRRNKRILIRLFRISQTIDSLHVDQIIHGSGSVLYRSSLLANEQMHLKEIGGLY